MQLIAGEDVVDELLPILGCICGLCAVALARAALVRARITEITAEQFDDIVD